MTKSAVLRTLRRSSRNSRCKSSRVIGSSAANGSSNSSSGGSAASARAIPTRCFCPPESCARIASAEFAGRQSHRGAAVRPRAARCAPAPSLPAAAPARRWPPPSSAETGRRPGSRTPCGAAIGSGPTRRSRAPQSESRRPESGISPLTVLSRVVLPDPLRPSRTTVSPSPTSRLISRRIVRPPMLQERSRISRSASPTVLPYSGQTAPYDSRPPSPWLRRQASPGSSPAAPRPADGGRSNRPGSDDWPARRLRDSARG